MNGDHSQREIPWSSIRPSPLEWLYLVIGSILVVHYAWLLDDAFVYFRYVDNLVLLDRGLVYNPGEYLEAFTSVAWLFVLVGFRALGLPFWPVVQVFGVLSFALFWGAGVVANRTFSPQGSRDPAIEGPVINLPLAFLCANYGALCYFTSGTGSPLVQLFAGITVLFALRPTWRPASYLLPLLPLVRPELALTLMAVMVWFWLRTGRIPWTMILTAAIVDGGWLAFRILYYADLFPTIYYLKELPNYSQGLRFLHDTLGPYHLYELGAASLIAFAWLLYRHGRLALRLDARAFLWFVIAMQTLYVIRVGGDARHFRYLTFATCLLLLSFGGLAEHGLSRLSAHFQSFSPRQVLTAARLAGLALLGLSLSAYPRQLAASPVLSLDAKPEMVDLIADAAHHRHHKYRFSPLPWSSGDELELRDAYSAWRGGERDRPTKTGHHIVLFTHYQNFDTHWLHSAGYTDALLARVVMPFDRPSHKYGLYPMAGQLNQLVHWWGRPVGRGMYRAAVESGVAPDWIEANLDVIETIESKIYNRGDWLENIRLAFQIDNSIHLVPKEP